MSKFVCNHCFIDYGDKQSFIEHTHKVVERKEKRAVKSTTKSQTDNTELDSLGRSKTLQKLLVRLVNAHNGSNAKDGLSIFEAQTLIEAWHNRQLKQQDIKSRIDELEHTALDVGEYPDDIQNYNDELFGKWSERKLTHSKIDARIAKLRSLL